MDETDAPPRDTVAVGVGFSIYHMAANPHYQAKLYEEIAPCFGKTVPGEFANSDLAKIDFLEGWINETLRLDNPVSNNGARLTPPEGIVVDDVWIPGGTAVRVPGYGMQRSKFITGVRSQRVANAMQNDRRKSICRARPVHSRTLDHSAGLDP